MNHGALNGSISILRRYVHFPSPIKSNLFRLNIVEGSKSLAVKLDLLGTSPEKSHRSDSMFEQIVAQNGAHVVNECISIYYDLYPF